MKTRNRPGVALDPEGAETRAIHEQMDFADKNVLEIGCGDGRLTARFAAGARSVLAVDPDAVSIARASADLPETLRQKVTFQIGDITTMPLPANTFDAAVLSWSL